MDEGGEEEEERRAQIDGTLDEVVEASLSVVIGSRILRLRRRQLVSGGELIDGSAHPRLESTLLRRELMPHPRRRHIFVDAVSRRRHILVGTAFR